MLLEGKHATEDDLKAIDKEIKDIVNEAAEFSKESPEPAWKSSGPISTRRFEPQNA
jgi:pyruvate dehydrogenase E1 component alpha subunit